MLQPVQSKVILVVEDNAGDALIIEELLTAGGFPRVKRVGRLSEALASLRSDDVGAVLLDLGLPDGSGVECVEAIRGWAPDLPVVILTGRDEGPLAHACLVAGAQDYFQKGEIRAEGLRRSIGYSVARVQERAAQRHADALQRRLAAIVESSRDAIVSTTVEGVITSWNKGAEEIFGYAPAEAIGRPLKEVIRVPDGGAEGSTVEVTKPLLDGGSRASVEVERLRKDGSTVQVSIVAGRLRDAAGEVVGIAAIARDVTELRRRDDELRRRNEELLLRDRQMRALSARLNAIREDERARISREVHDELGQLLTGLKLDVHWIRKRIGAAGRVELDPVADRLAEADALVDTTIGTVQRIALELRPSALDTLGLPAALRDEARRFGQRAGVVVSTRIPDGMRRIAPEAATALFRISQELLTNVARHARATRVSIDLEERDGGLLLRIEDDGIGIASERAGDWSSLGLLGMQERAAALGGHVTIEGVDDGGTVAVVRLPRGGEAREHVA